MAAFSDVIGQELVTEHLKAAVESKKINHAYLFCGEKGTGKKMMAKLFAKAILCEAGGTDSCGECVSCKQVESGNHPDLKIVIPEKTSVIGVDDVREQVNQDIVIKPYSSSYKIYILDEVDKMTVQAQNALLKTLEEPPAYGVFLLLALDAQSVLPTIRSRCVILQMKPVSSEKVQAYLIDTYHIPEHKAKICASFAQGNMGKAIRMASSDTYGELQEQVLNLVKNVDDMDLYVIMDAVKRLSEHKADIEDVIDMMMVWYRDVMILKLTNNPNLLVYPEEYSALSKKASKSTYEGLDTIIRGMEKAKVRLRANVNFDVALEMMLLTIKEN